MDRLLGKGASIVPKEFKEGVGISLHVKLHLPLLHNLEGGNEKLMVDDEGVVWLVTSNFASEMRCSISKRWSIA